MGVTLNSKAILTNMEALWMFSEAAQQLFVVLKGWNTIP